MRGTRQQIEVVSSPADLVVVAQQLIAAAANVSIGRRGFFRVALAGGSTPRAVYAALAAGENLNWERWQIFWSDERCVPPTSSDSNYRMAKETLLDPLTRQGDAPRMVVRLAGSEAIPVWQIPVSIAIGIAAMIFMAWATAKIFRIGVLMYGKPPNVRTLIKWVRMA